MVGLPCHCGVLSGILGLHPPDAKSLLQNPVVTTQNVSRHGRMSPRGPGSSPVEIPCQTLSPVDGHLDCSQAGTVKGNTCLFVDLFGHFSGGLWTQEWHSWILVWAYVFKVTLFKKIFICLTFGCTWLSSLHRALSSCREWGLLAAVASLAVEPRL